MKLEHVSRMQTAPLNFNLHGDSPVQRLCHDIDAAFAAFESGARASFGTRVRAALERAIAQPDLLDAHQRIGNPHAYCRHLLAADPFDRYAIAALVWSPGQTSPVHGHQTWCGYAVLEGALTETLYRWDAAAQRAVQTRRHPRAAGAVSYVDAGRSAIHQLGNPADAASCAVSLHIYGVAGAKLATHVNDLLAA